MGIDLLPGHNAIVQPMTGWLATRMGRKNLLMTSVIGFTLASFCCGLAPTLPLLILFRLLQGAFGGTCSRCPKRFPRNIPARKAR